MSDPHPPSADVAYASAGELLRRLAAREITSHEIVRSLRDRAAAIDDAGPSLKSLAALDDTALAIADERDAQRARGGVAGPLHGVPVLIKDNIEARGLPGLAGSTALRGRPARDAELVARLRASGAIVLGSTNLSQWANIRSPQSTSGYSASGGLVANPWALDRSAGGSSSGSGAAVAAGLAPLVVGTETDGSITCPASLNGVAGLKPTVGKVSRAGVVPISHSQDSPGPLARNVQDLALLYGVLAGEEVPAPNPAIRLVESISWRTGHRETDQLFEVVMEHWRASGASIDQCVAALPGPEQFDDELTVLLGELVDGMDSYLKGRSGEGVHSLREVVMFEDENLESEQRYFGHEFFVRALASGGCASAEYRAARERNARWALEEVLNPALEGCDIIVAPAYGPAWKSDLVNGDNAKYSSASIMSAAVAGWPLLTVPMGLVHGLPVGLTLVGRPHSEWLLLQVAREVQELVTRYSPLPGPSWRVATRG